MSLKDKNILIGISGGIAAYKIPYLVRLFRKADANVKVLMTPNAAEFVGPITLSTLSAYPVYIEPFDKVSGEWNSHIELAEWADIQVFAPTTANTLGKMVNGIADNLLITTYLSARSHVVIAPAMDLDMYQHPSTKKNLEILKSYGHTIIEPTSGELASGLCGAGRLQEPDVIFEVVSMLLKKKLNS